MTYSLIGLATVLLIIGAVALRGRARYLSILGAATGAIAIACQ